MGWLGINGMTSCVGSFYDEILGNCFHCTIIFTFIFFCGLFNAKSCSHTHTHTHTHTHIYIYIYIYIYYHYHHHHVVPPARISLTLSRHFSLSFIASGRSSWLHPVSSQSCCMYVRAGRPVFARPYVGVHRSTSLMSSSLLLQQHVWFV